MKRTTLLASSAAALAAFQADASAQSRFLFSIDWQSPSVGSVDPNGFVITEGDILRPPTPDSLPSLTLPSGPEVVFEHTTALGLPTGCAGHPGGTPCVVEVDAFSMGGDEYFLPNFPLQPGRLCFSVDEWGLGNFANPAPSLDTEYPAKDSSADTWINAVTLPPVPIPPAPGRHVALSDGDAAPSASGALYPGVGLKEPNPDAPGPMDNGDNLDALDVHEPSPVTVVGRYFSLDSGVFDPFEGVPGSASAMFSGFVGGDVLTVGPLGSPVMYAPAAVLGLDAFGTDTDDLDALILRENGFPGYQPSSAIFDWAGGTAASDMLVFSVRRGSALIGAPDSIFGIPIEEGDLLVPPVAGGVSPFPGILIAGENLGLATLRSGTGNFSADVNAADSLRGPVLDCDGDGIEDSIAILMGIAADADGNGVPDGCGGPTIGPIGTPFCFCPTAVAPCGNASTTTGCLNSVGTGALLTASGPQIGGASITAPDNLVLTTSGMPGPTFMLMFYGPTVIPPTPLGNGLRCVGPGIFRLPPILAVPASGIQSYGPGVVGMSAIHGPPGTITAGTTWSFQTWYRELGPGPCGMGSNLSNALTITFI
ncbi:MAG: hypothetical protein AAFQ53_07815 [Bacteroidota bacterium]